MFSHRYPLSIDLPSKQFCSKADPDLVNFAFGFWSDVGERGYLFEILTSFQPELLYLCTVRLAENKKIIWSREI